MRLLLLLIPLNCFAAGAWERIEFKGGYWEFDRASIIAKDDTRRILVRLTLSGMLVNKDTGKQYDHSVMIVELDCVKRLRRVLDVATYFRAERVEGGRTSADWADVGSMSALHKAAC